MALRLYGLWLKISNDVLSLATLQAQYREGCIFIGLEGYRSKGGRVILSGIAFFTNLPERPYGRLKS
jgi:hypothetical protein